MEFADLYNEWVKSKPFFKEIRDNFDPENIDAFLDQPDDTYYRRIIALYHIMTFAPSSEELSILAQFWCLSIEHIDFVVGIWSLEHDNNVDHNYVRLMNTFVPQITWYPILSQLLDKQYNSEAYQFYKYFEPTPTSIPEIGYSIRVLALQGYCMKSLNLIRRFANNEKGVFAAALESLLDVLLQACIDSNTISKFSMLPFSKDEVELLHLDLITNPIQKNLWNLAHGEYNEMVPVVTTGNLIDALQRME